MKHITPLQNVVGSSLIMGLLAGIETRSLPAGQQPEIRSFEELEIRVDTTEGKAPVVSGYAAVFDSASRDFGGWVEIIKPGAFTRTLKENKDILCLRDHDYAQILGRTGANTLEIKEDDKGLWYRVELPNTTFARDLAEMIKRKDVRGGSFGFRVPKNGDNILRTGGKIVRELLDINLYEVTVTGIPAYEGTSTQVRSAADVAERVKLLDEPAKPTMSRDEAQQLLRRAQTAI